MGQTTIVVDSNYVIAYLFLVAYKYENCRWNKWWLHSTQTTKKIHTTSYEGIQEMKNAQPVDNERKGFEVTRVKSILELIKVLISALSLLVWHNSFKTTSVLEIVIASNQPTNHHSWRQFKPSTQSAEYTTNNQKYWKLPNHLGVLQPWATVQQFRRI